MRMFLTRKPRPFNHKLVYACDRREQLKAMGERSKLPALRGMSTSLTIALIVLLLLLVWIVSH